MVALQLSQAAQSQRAQTSAAAVTPHPSPSFPWSKREIYQDHPRSTFWNVGCCPFGLECGRCVLPILWLHPKKTIVDTANIRENIPQTKWNADCRHRLRVNYPLDINKPTLGPYHVTRAANSLVAGYELANRLFALPPRKASYKSAGCFRGGGSTWERSCCWNCSCGKVWHHHHLFFGQ